MQPARSPENDFGEVDVERDVPGRDRARDADGFAHHAPGGVETILAARAPIDFPLDVREHLDEHVGPLERTIHLGTEGGTQRRSRLVACDIHELLPVLPQQISKALQ